MDIKLKNKILIIGFISALFIVYKFAISKTFETQKIVSELSNEKLLLSDISDKILALKAKEAQLDVVLKKRNISINNSFQQTLLQSVTSFSKQNKMQIIAFSEPHIFRTNVTKLSTYSFEVKGRFNAILKMINFIQKLQLGELIAINFERKKNFRTNIDYLTCKVLLQRISN